MPSYEDLVQANSELLRRVGEPVPTVEQQQRLIERQQHEIERQQGPRGQPSPGVSSHFTYPGGKRECRRAAPATT